MTSVFENHERIWLEPCEPVDNIEGRMWCEDNQWGKDGVEYIRADLLSALTNTSGDDEAYGYVFQHEETGLQQVVDVQQVEWGFEKNNPRWQKIFPVYARPQSAAVRDELRAAAEAVVWFDWSSNDSDAVLAIDRLRAALQSTQEG